MSDIRRQVMAGTEVDQMNKPFFQLLSPKKHTYEGLESVLEAYQRWLAVRHALRKIKDEDRFAAPVSKDRAHKAMDAAFRCFDENPENLKAKHYRDLLQQAAQILELPPLGKEIKLGALSSAATKTVAPPPKTP
jgi:hypothetical protein